MSTFAEKERSKSDAAAAGVAAISLEESVNANIISAPTGKIMHAW